MKFKFFYVQLIFHLTLVCLIACDIEASPLALTNKTTIKQLEDKLSHVPPDEKSPIQVELTKAYYKDQNVEKAILIYLEALKNTQRNTTFIQKPEDEKLYNNALRIYLEHHGLSFLEAEKSILNEYGPKLKDNPDYRELGFVVAASQANLGQFSDFFDTFYNSYAVLPDHYMAYKTKGILHIKLFERTIPGPEREKIRNSILENLNEAAERFPGDSSLYKMMINFSPEENKAQILEVNLNKIINRNIIIPRAELEFFIRQAIIADKTDLAQKFLAKAKEWYKYSRVIDSAQKYIDNSKMKQSE